MKLVILMVAALIAIPAASASKFHPHPHGHGHHKPPVTTPAPTTSVAPQVDRMGACELSGQYVDVTAAQFFSGQFVDSSGVIQALVPTNWLQGVGETCDNPANLGFTYAGYKVDDGGSVYEQDATFNVYPYFVR